MTTTVPDSRASEQPTEQLKPKAPLYHFAASWDDFVAALSGRPWTAVCGKRCKSHSGPRHRSTLAPIESCAVCTDLVHPERGAA